MRELTQLARVGRPISKGRSSGFTLVELLVVISIIAALAALLLPALNKTKEQGRATLCRSNMKQITLGILAYADDNDYYLPWPGDSNSNRDPDWVWGGETSSTLSTPSAWGMPDFGFRAEAGSVYSYVTMLPRVPKAAYDKSKLNNSYPVYRCPSTGKLGESLRVNFTMNAWLNPGEPGSSDRGVMETGVVNPVEKVLLANSDPFLMRSASLDPNALTTPNVFLSHNGRVNIGFIDSHIESKSPQEIVFLEKPFNRDHYFDTSKP